MQVVREAVDTGAKGLQDLLGIMSSCRSSPRRDKTNLPATEVLEVPAHKRAKLVGNGGINIRRITSETGARITALEGKKSNFVLSLSKHTVVDRFGSKIKFSSFVFSRQVEPVRPQP